MTRFNSNSVCFVLLLSISPQVFAVGDLAPKASRVSALASAIASGVCAILPPQISNSLFSRGSGYWTTSASEGSQDMFTQLMLPASQREDWYVLTPYIAEFGCTISNVGFFYVGLKHSSARVAFAGLASAVSHSIPLEILHKLDFLGVAVAGTLLWDYWKQIVTYPSVFMPQVGVILAANFADAQLARRFGTSVPHYAWHLIASMVLDRFLTQAKSLKEADNSR